MAIVPLPVTLKVRLLGTPRKFDPGHEQTVMNDCLQLARVYSVPVGSQGRLGRIDPEPSLQSQIHVVLAKLQDVGSFVGPYMSDGSTAAGYLSLDRDSSSCTSVRRSSRILSMSSRCAL